MRVALDVTPLLHGHSGAATGAAAILHALHVRQGVDVYGWTMGRSAARPPGIDADVEICHRQLPAAIAHQLWQRVGRPTSEHLFGRHDVVHGTNFVVPPTRSAAAVVTVHDLTPVEHPDSVPKGALAYPALIGAALRRGAMIHTPSEYVAAGVREHYGVGDDRVRSVPWGIDEILPTEPGAGAALAGTDNYILAVGTVKPRKNLAALVAAFELVADEDAEIALVVAGAEGWNDGGLAATIAASRHRDRIRRIRTVAVPDRDALLTDAATLVFPSIDEGFGFPPLEAMEVGTPVVATTAGSVPEVVGDAAILVEPTDIEGLAAGIQRILTDDVLVAELVDRGHRRVEQLSWTACADGLVELYRHAAGA